MTDDRKLDDPATWLTIRADLRRSIALLREETPGGLPLINAVGELDRMMASTRDAGFTEAQGAVMAMLCYLKTIYHVIPGVAQRADPLIAPALAAAFLMEVLPDA
jgi:hypothetical protein